MFSGRSFFRMTRLLSNAGRIFTKHSLKDAFAVLFIDDGTLIKSFSQIFWGPNIHFWAKIQTPPSWDGRCAETRRNSGKTKTIGIGYPHIHVWWNSVRGHLSYREFLRSAFWPMAPAIRWTGNISKTAKRTELSVAVRIIFWCMAFPTV